MYYGRKKIFTTPLLVCTLVLALLVGATEQMQAQQKAKMHKVKVLAEFPHDIGSYTQGLFFLDGQLWETTGQYGQSHLIMVNLQTGKWIRKWKFNKKYFIEGSCAFGQNLYILTWMEHICFVYTLNNPEKKLKEVGKASYPTEGWGITTDGKNIIMSDGSSQLYFMDPASLYCTSRLNVTLNGKPLEYINELEWIDGKIWANVYLSDNIVIIDPATGVVTDIIECANILPQKLRTKATDVLNGIAYNPLDKSIYITGKYWPRLYKIAKP